MVLRHPEIQKEKTNRKIIKMSWNPISQILKATIQIDLKTINSSFNNFTAIKKNFLNSKIKT